MSHVFIICKTKTIILIRVVSRISWLSSNMVDDMYTLKTIKKGKYIGQGLSVKIET